MRRRRHQPRVSNLAAGIISVAVIAVACYLVFGGSLPFASSPFVLKALYTTPTQLHIPSPVRIAGVDVGQVTGVTRVPGSSDAATITMQIDPSGLPIHQDATAAIRPRLFLEGNFYVDLSPGSPSSPTLASGATLPAASTAGPVQLDRVLSVLTTNPRTQLQTLLQGLGEAFDGQPTRAQDASQDASVRGLTAGQALNQSLDYSAQALEASAIVNQALLGLQPHDLSGVVVGNQRVFGALAAQHTQLADLVASFDTTMAALAAQQQNLSRTIALLPPLLRTTNSALGPLDASFAPTREFAGALLPAVRELGPTIDAGLPWLAQTSALLSPSELGGLISSLTPAVRDTTTSLNSIKTLLGSTDQLTRCFLHNITPTGNEVISDPPVSTGLKVYQELFQSAVGLAGASQNFDGNGRYIRASVAGGSDRVQTSAIPFGVGPLYGNAVLAPIATRPAWPGQAPPVVGDIPCYENPAPDLNDVRTGPAP